jgi:hypothetical protein
VKSQVNQVIDAQNTDTKKTITSAVNTRIEDTKSEIDKEFEKQIKDLLK